MFCRIRHAELGGIVRIPRQNLEKNALLCITYNECKTENNDSIILKFLGIVVVVVVVVVTYRLTWRKLNTIASRTRYKNYREKN